MEIELNLFAPYSIFRNHIIQNLYTSRLVSNTSVHKPSFAHQYYTIITKSKNGVVGNDRSSVVITENKNNRYSKT